MTKRRLCESQSYAERGLDCYPSPPEAVASLIWLEGHRIPQVVWEPAAGFGNIVTPLRESGRVVYASDIENYGFELDYGVADYLTTLPPWDTETIVTNPPFRLAEEFLAKSLTEAPYVAYLLRVQWLEGIERMAMFKACPPSRIWVSSRRLPMMHRAGYTGPKSTSNTCFAWFIFQRGDHTCQVGWFDWKNPMANVIERL
jgi:hypothetical protein